MARPSESLHEPVQTPLRPQTDWENWDNLSDEEAMALLSRDNSKDKYAVSHLEPDGMKYQWVRCEVFGKPDFNRPAEMEQKGWRPVPSERHPGTFMPPDAKGPIIVDGMQLYELPSRIVRLKREVASRVATDKVRDMNDQLIYTPQGTGPRMPRTPNAPVVKRESGTMPLVVE